MNLQKIKDHFPEYSDMKIGEFFKYMHKTYYPNMKITDMYKALLKLTEIVEKEEVEEVEAEEVKTEPEAEPKQDDAAINELKKKIEILTQKIEAMTEKPKEDEEPEKEDKDLDKIMVKTKAVYNGNIVSIDMKAAEALKDIDDAIDSVKEMIDCIEDMESLDDVLDKHDIPNEYRDKINKHSKQLQKQNKTTLEADKHATKQLLKIYQKEKANIEQQIEAAE